jgi:hypothetical protein
MSVRLADIKHRLFPNICLVYSVVFFLYIGYLLSFGRELLENTLVEKTCILFFYTFFGFLPLIFFLVKENDKINQELTAITQDSFKLLWDKRKVYFPFLGLFAVFYLWMAHFHIGTLDERVRWFADKVPHFPYDPPFPTRFSLVLSWLIPFEFVTPLISLASIFVWFVFLIYIGEGKSVSALIFTFLVMFSNAYILDESIFANMELPAAIFGFVGLYGVLKKRFTLAILFLTLSCIFKITGLFFLVCGFVITIYYFFKNKNTLKQINFSLLIVCFVFIIINQAGLFFYVMIIRGGPGYIITIGNHIFWLSSLKNFLVVFLTGYLFLFVIAAIGIIFDEKHRKSCLVLLFLLLLFRCSSRLSDGYYVLFFIPSLSFGAFYGLNWLFKKLGNLRVINLSAALVLIAISTFQFFCTLDKVNNRLINKYNSNFTSLVKTLAKELPKDTVIYQRRISLKPYLSRLGRKDIVYLLHNENKEEVLELLRKGNKPALLFDHKNDVGITEEELSEIGFKHKFELIDKTNGWRLLFKDS